MDGEAQSFEHHGRISNAPLEWALTGYDGNYIAKLNGGSVQERALAINKAFDGLCEFSEKFGDSVKGSGPALEGQPVKPSCVVLSTPNHSSILDPKEYPDGQTRMEGVIRINYEPKPGNSTRGSLKGPSKADEMRTFIEQCLGISTTARMMPR